MRTLVIALVLGLFAVGTASAAPRHGRKHHSHSMKHAKLKRHSAAKHA
jgi:hypothetical protein